ncbi:MAG: XrtA system polysaccharide chain length determinant [Dokdonella sp.]
MSAQRPPMSPAAPGIGDLLPILLHQIWRQRLALVAGFAAIAIAVLAIGAALPKKFESETTILAQENNIIKPLMEGRAVPTGVADRGAMAREVVFSRKVMNQILAIGGWMKKNPTPIEQERIIGDIAKRTTISNSRDNLIRIAYADSDPQRSFTVATQMADLFMKESLEAKARESRDAFNFIDNQVNEYQIKLTTAETKLNAYHEKHPDSRPGVELDINARVGELRRQTETDRVELARLQSVEGSLQAQLSGKAPVRNVVARTPQGSSRLTELQSELDRLLISYTEQHPDVIRVRKQIRELQTGDIGGGSTTVVTSASPVYQDLRNRLAETHASIAAIQARSSGNSALLESEVGRSQRVANADSALTELTSDYTIYRDVYQDLLKRRENARVSMSLDAEHSGLSFVVQEPAQFPLEPYGIRFMYFCIGGLLAAVLIPLGVLVAVTQLDPRVRSSQQLEHATGLPAMATVPTYATAGDRVRERSRNGVLALILVAVVVAYAVMFGLRAGGLL